MTTSSEPDAAGQPVRRFVDADYQPLCATLGEVRERIDALDEQIVALLAQRARCVKDATRFKRDVFQVAAPARQAQVYARVRKLAAEHAHHFPGLPDVVEATYRTLVAGFIAAEAQLFQDSESLKP